MINNEEKKRLIQQAIEASIKIASYKEKKKELLKLNLRVFFIKNHMSTDGLDFINNEIESKIKILEEVVKYRLKPLINPKEENLYGECVVLDDLVFPTHTYKSINYISSAELKAGYIRLDNIDNDVTRKRLDLTTGQLVDETSIEE
jgi:hypothetical protein